MSFSETPRRSVVAGRFYPGDPGELKERVARFLALDPPSPVDLGGREALAALVPHAGYVFSGAIAGMTLGRAAVPARVILLGPNHTGRGAPVSLWSGGPWLTPLGAAKIDEASRTALAESGAGFVPDTAAHLEEHSLEVLVPFFQVIDPEIRITPVTVAGVSPEALREAGDALAGVVSDAAGRGEKILLAVSSDMSHYLPHAKAAALDALALDALKTLDPATYFKTVRENGISMCGVFPMTMALFALAKLGASAAHVVAYATSGQTGRAFGADMNKVVGYAGVIIV